MIFGFQIQQAADENSDSSGRRQVWKCESSRSFTTIKEYAGYQKRVFLGQVCLNPFLDPFLSLFHPLSPLSSLLPSSLSSASLPPSLPLSIHSSHTCHLPSNFPIPSPSLSPSSPPQEDSAQSDSSDSPHSDPPGVSGGVGVGGRNRPPPCRKPRKSIRFGTNVDLSDQNKWSVQLQQLEKLPKFCRVSLGRKLASLGWVWPWKLIGYYCNLWLSMA